ncbi:hypothetical protein R3P38DRAFT_2553698, partial [Favolaschia claudopus]
MARTTISAHAARNPTRRVQTSRYRPGKSAAARASDALRLSAMRSRRLDFNAAINAEFASRNTAITRIAKDFHRSESYIRGLLTSVSQFRAHRRPSLRRALLHQRWLDLPEGDLDKLQAELREDIEDGTVVIEDIDDTERKRLIDQLIEHRTTKRKGIRGTTKAAQLDTRLTAKKMGEAAEDLYDRTGDRAMVFITRGDADDPSRPFCADSGGALEFLTQVLDISEYDFLRKFELWSCTRDRGPQERNGINDVRKEVSQLIQDGLRKITNNKTITMEYVHYDVAIREAKRVELAGWPGDVKIKDRERWSAETGRRIRRMLQAGEITWVVMTKNQHDELVAAHDKLRANSTSGSLRKRKERSDKGKPRGSRKGKDGGEENDEDD